MPIPPFPLHSVSSRVTQGLFFIAALAIAVHPLAAQESASDPSTTPKPNEVAAGIEFFEKHVRPLLVDSCYECHGEKEASGGLRVDSRAGWIQGGDSGPAIVPGKPEESRLIEAIRYRNQDLQMPPKAPLGAAQVAILEQWVAMGAPDPRETASVKNVSNAMGMSLEDGRKFWAFQPLLNPQVPTVQDASWVRTPVDAFILARLESEGLKPAPTTDRRTWLRRVTYDLTGLPPTREEINAFDVDESDEAFDRVVQRLLQSPSYGVRWGRHWLDVARYADSNGLDENLAFGTAWRYRDYVVDAFNRDKPFNRFVIEQIAGDLLPDASAESKTATGFLVLGAKVLAEPDREKLEMDTIDEQIDTLGKAFLGMTFGCVRCHDHKFDPVTQADYYGLAAIFKGTKTFGDTNFGAIKHWNEHVFASAEEQARIKEVEAEIAKKKQAAASFRSEAVAKIRAEARSKATEYLIAAAQFEPSAPLTVVAEIAAPQKLHPRILHQCRLHLEYQQQDPFFGPWHELAKSNTPDLSPAVAIERHYRPLFERAEAAWAEAKAKDTAVKQLDLPELERARAALYDPSGFLTVPAKPEFALDEASLATYHQLSEEARLLESNAPDLTSAMGVTDGVACTSLPIHIRGSHRNLGNPVTRQLPAVMRGETDDMVWPRHQSGRLELAQWLASPRNPLTARVYVNRVWRWHFGVGLVSSTDNFGVLGERPSHPELLDWLARYFIESGWSTKELNRLILTSSVYRMSSDHPSFVNAALASSAEDKSRASEMEKDPENRLLWHFRRQRLEAEQIRDAVLAVAGDLDPKLGGKAIPLRNRQFVFDHTSIDHTKYDSRRRALYLPIVRNNVYTLFEQFDFPDPTMPTGSRNATVVAPQALLMLNSELMIEAADRMALNLIAEHPEAEQRVMAAYWTAFGREPSAEELARATRFVEQFMQADSRDLPGAPLDAAAAWSLFCQSLFASNEFIYLR